MTIRTGSVRAGRLKRRITIQQIGTNPNGTRGWVDLFPAVWAESLPLTGAEGAHELGPMNVQSIMFNIRYRPGVKAQQRVVMRNRIMEIQSVINQEEANVQLTLVCREAPPGT